MFFIALTKLSKDLVSNDLVSLIKDLIDFFRKYKWALAMLSVVIQGLLSVNIFF